MRTDRLKRLAEFLRTVPPERFWMDAWADSPQFPECGTFACAGGWATVLFSADGLRLIPTDRVDDADVYFETHIGSKALRVFFDLTKDDILRIFEAAAYGDHSATPTEVADRIDQIVKATNPPGWDYV